MQYAQKRLTIIEQNGKISLNHKCFKEVKMKLKNKMLVSIGIPVAVVTLLLTLISFFVSRNMLISDAEDLFREQAEKYGSDIETQIHSEFTYINSIALILKGDTYTDQTISNQLNSVSKTVGEDVFLAFEDKKFIDGMLWVPDASYDPTAKDWYKDAISKEGISLSRPYLGAIDNLPVVTISKKVEVNNRNAVLGKDVSTREIQELVKGITIQKTGKAYLINSEGNYISHETYSLEDNIKSKDSELANLVLNSEDSFINHSGLMLQTCHIKNTDWILVLYAPKSEILVSANVLFGTMFIIGSISLIIILIVIYFLGRSITNPIEKLSASINEMENYDMTLNDGNAFLLYSKSKNEIGDISRSLIKVKNTMKDIIININKVSNRLSASSEELTANSEESAASAEEVANSIKEISDKAETQASDIQYGMQSMQVMEDSLNENQGVIEDLNTTSSYVFTAQENGLKSIDALVTATSNVMNSSENVSEVIKNTNESAIKISKASDMIKTIADQTNLLALNAAIEAARAGEAGKGFAVVAEEIRKLAEQSNSFTEEIKKIVVELNNKTEEAVTIMNEVSTTVKEQSGKVEDTKQQFAVIEEQINNTMGFVKKLNDCEKKIYTTKDKLTEIIDNLSVSSQENAKLSKDSIDSIDRQTQSSTEIASASSELSEMAQQMSEIISKFKV